MTLLFIIIIIIIIIIIFIFAIYATFYTRGNTGLILSQASSLKNRS